MMLKKSGFVLSLAVTCSLFVAPAAMAGSHSWDIVEAFTNPDGSIQFIELMECCGLDGETNLAGKQVTSDATGSAFTFPANLVGPTGKKHLLLATQSFADLPGAPTPDYIIEPNFFDPEGDMLRYHVYDAWAIPGKFIPTDCVNSLKRDYTSSPNTPTNYDDETGQVHACPCPSDLSGDGVTDVFDLLSVLGAWGQCADCPEDLNSDGDVNVFDLLTVLSAWGPCEQ